MREFIPTSQTIIATCILNMNDTVLLLRGSQVLGETREMINQGYFDIPRFKIKFGETPQEVITRQFKEYFKQDVCEIKVVDVHQQIINNDSEQVFEIVYNVQCDDFDCDSGVVGKFLFVHRSELESYMLENNLVFIQKYIE